MKARKGSGGPCEPPVSPSSCAPDQHPALIVTALSLVVEQPSGPVTVTRSVTVPELPAVNRMLRAVLPPVIAPFSIVHAYVAPLPAVRTDAVFPVELAQAVDDALMDASGDATRMRADPLEVPAAHHASESAVIE